MPIGFMCLTSANFSMRATILKQGMTPGNYNPQDTVGGGVVRHPITGEIIRDWTQIDNPNTDYDESFGIEVPCLANGISNGGLNSQGAAERWSSKGSYDLNDFVEIKFPMSVDINSRDKITNIKDSSGNILWLEEEYSVMKEVDGVMTPVHPPSVFHVGGVSIETDIFGQPLWKYTLINRSETS